MRKLDSTFATSGYGVLNFGAHYARRLGRRRGHPGDTWHLDEIFCKINDALMYLARESLNKSIGIVV
jgi:transposase-like protein